MLLLSFLVPTVNPLDDQCNHWNTTAIPTATEPTVDCMTSSVVNSGRKQASKLAQYLFVYCLYI